MRPRSWKAFAALPFYVRSGMKAASIHKGHPYLTHQAATLWGNGMTRRLLPLEWGDVSALFAGRQIDLGGRTVDPGEVLLRHGPWSLTRGLVRADGSLSGFLPRALRTEALTRLRDWGASRGPGPEAAVSVRTQDSPCGNGFPAIRSPDAGISTCEDGVRHAHRFPDRRPASLLRLRPWSPAPSTP